jgi:hypothetical protein
MLLLKFTFEIATQKNKKSQTQRPCDWLIDYTKQNKVGISKQILSVCVSVSVCVHFVFHIYFEKGFFSFFIFILPFKIERYISQFF